MFLVNYLRQFLLVIIVLIITGTAHSADYPPNIDYGSQGDFITKTGTEYGRTADLTLVGPLLVNLPEGPGSSSNGVTWLPQATVWDLSDLTNPSLIRSLTCDTCFLGAPVFSHATVIRFDNNDGYLYTRNDDPANPGDHLTFNPTGATSNDQAVPQYLDWGFNPLSYTMLFSPYNLRRWWDYGDNPAGLQSIRDPSRLLPQGEPERWLGEYLVSWDHLGETGVTGFAAWLGNLVVMSSDQQSTGMAIYDVSGFKDGELPRLLSTYQPQITEPDGNQTGIGGYWMEPYGTTKMVWAARQRGTTPERNYPSLFIVDFTDPTDPQLTCELYFDQDKNDPSDGDDSSNPMYVNFQDNYAYVDHFRVDINACETAYADEQISTAEFEQIVYRFDDIENGCDGSQYFRPLGQVGIFGGYDWWVTRAVVTYTGGTMPIGQYMTNQNGVGLEAVRHLGTGESVISKDSIQEGDVITSQGQMFTVTDVAIDERINEQGMCFMVTSDEPDTTPPFVSGHRPLADQVNYPVDGFIHIHIPETLRTETVVDAITVTDIDSNETVEFRYQLSHTGTLSIWPNNDLTLGSTYEVSLSGIQDFMGNTMDPYSFRFSTGIEIIGEPVPEPDMPRTSAPSYTGDAFYPNQSSQLACEPEIENGNGSGNVWAVNPDNDSVTIVSRSIGSGNFELTTEVTKEIKLNYEHPTSVTKVNNTFAVTYRDDDKVVFFDPQGNPIRSLDTGHGTQPIASVAQDSTLFVALYGSGEVIKIDTLTGTVSSRLPVGPTPKAMALSDTRLLVTRYISNAELSSTGPSNQQEAQVYDINTTGTMSLTRTIPINKVLVPDDIDHGAGLPNYLSSIVINPENTQAYITAVKANIDRGLFRSNQALDEDNTIRPILITLDLINNRDANINPETRSNAIDLDNAADPAGITFLPDGVTRVHSLQGNNLVILNNLASNTSANFETGFASQSMCSTLRTLYVKNFTDRTLSAIDIANWMHDGSQNPLIQTVSTVATEALSAQELVGLQTFYHARIPDISPEGYISCASCHAGGGHDGMTWDMTHMGEGLRNTLSLNGASGTRFGNLHWSQNFDEVQDFEIQMEQLNGGVGLIPGITFQNQSPLDHMTSGASEDLDALASYVNSLGKERVKRSPHRSYTGELTAQAERGRAVFTEKGCQSCHSGKAFRDGLGHDVGTIKSSSGRRLGVEGGLIDIRTPSLIELWDSAPYFHDGSAATLRDVLRTGTHQTEFAGTEENDLSEFLLSIDRELYIDDGADFPEN